MNLEKLEFHGIKSSIGNLCLDLKCGNNPIRELIFKNTDITNFDLLQIGEKCIHLNTLYIQALLPDAYMPNCLRDHPQTTSPF